MRALRAASGLYAIHLSDEGLVEVHRLKELQKNRAARLRHTMDVFHRWLFNTTGDHEPINPVLFLDTPWSFFAGAVITESELHEALGYLSEHQLIKYIETEPVTVAITPQGVSCALAGGSVQEYTNRQRPGTTYNNFLPNAQGVIIGEQQNVTQNNTMRHRPERVRPSGRLRRPDQQHLGHARPGPSGTGARRPGAP